MSMSAYRGRNAARVDLFLVVVIDGSQETKILLVYQAWSVDESAVNILNLDFDIANSYSRSKPALFGCIQLPSRT